MRSRFLSAVLVAAASAAGCSQTPSPSTPASPASSAPAATSAAPAASAAPASSAAPATSAAPEKVATPTAWAKGLSKPQQIAFMKEVVMPRMTKVFQGADAKKYAEFGCKTCHGPEFKEPDEFLPHLTMKNGKITAFADKPAVSKFMAEKVVPEMAAAMGMKPYDPKTHEGFGCAGCHKIDQQ
ncbi:MAG: hypothetical protein IT374_21435 [Polyangiaceae bacterium]|nr:hypothetical protein [Polyangiaceae bacterium]